VGRVRIINPLGGGILYVSPGVPYYHATYGYGPSEVWKFSGDTPTLIWSTASERISCLFGIGSQAYAVHCTQGTVGTTNVTIYALSDTGATLVAGPLNITGWPMYVGQGAEVGDVVYLSAVPDGTLPGVDRHVLAFDPPAASLSVVYSAADSHRHGGIGVAGGKIYWCSGGLLHRSDDGVMWAQFADLTAMNLYVNEGFRSDPVGDAIWFGGWYYVTNNNQGRAICKIDGAGSITIEYNDGLGSLDSIGQASIVGQGATPTVLGIAASMSDGHAFPVGPVYLLEAGSWSLDADLSSLWDITDGGGGFLSNQGAVVLKGVPYVMYGSWWFDDSDYFDFRYSMHLIRRTGPGTWETVYTWDEYVGPRGSVYAQYGCTVVGSARKCHEV